MDMITNLGCACGKVHLEVRKAPLIVAECHCSSCREAGKRMRGLPGAVVVTEANGGTRFVMYRKDRVVFTSGFEHLREFRLGPGSTTRRVIADCCNMPIFLEFKGGHWLSIYSVLWPADTAPMPELRSMTCDRPDGEPLDDAVPSGGWATAKFYGRLLGAWVSMGFRVPLVNLEGRVIEIA